MEQVSRRLNPNAQPFYPSKSHHRFTASHGVVPQPSPPHPTTVSRHSKSFVRYPLSPVPRGPRNKTACRGRRPAAARQFNGGDNAGRMRAYREIMPLNPNEKSTTVMIRNIPNNYTRKLLVDFLEKHCKSDNEKAENTVRSAFDFVYLPVDFKYRLNAGYAFVNFTSPEAAWRFHKCVQGKSWELFQSKKIADVTRAKIQGKEALVRNFERMSLRSPSTEFLPVVFDPAIDGGSPASSTIHHTIGQVPLQGSVIV